MSRRTTCQARCAAKAISPSRKIRPPPRHQPGSGDQHHRAGIEARQHRRRALAEQQRGRLDADHQIVLAVLVRVDGVIADHPGDRPGIEHERRPIEPAEGGRPAHQRAPGEGEAEHDLRPIGDALHERIDGDHQQRGEAGHHREAVELDQHQQSDQRLRQHEERGLRDRHLFRRDRPRARALDQGVEIAIDQIVPGAAGAAHGKGADERTRRCATGSAAARPACRQARATTSTASATARSRSAGRGGRGADRGG